MKKLITPDWKNSNLNISATLAEFLNAPNQNSTLSVVEKELNKRYRNVVFICLDGMGINPLKKNLKKKDFLRRNIVQTLKSTFPSTTTNATTSLTSNLLPLEHGWLGWSLHFNEINRNIDIYLSSDSQTHEKVEFNYPIADNSNCYFDNAKTDYEIIPIMPEYVKTKNQNKISVIDEAELFEEIKKVCNKEGKHFIYAYNPEPDSTMHQFGVTSPQSKEKINLINNLVENLYNQVEDTLIIITSDHGQIDIKGFVEFYKDKELNDMLECVPYLDARTPAFIVKKDKHQEFKTKFNKKYGKDFKLFETKNLINQNYFGDRGKYGYILGDFIAVGTYTHKQFVSYENMDRFKGHHTSLTEEMLVPLIILKKEKNNER